MTDSAVPIASLPRVATIATMASRARSFEKAFPAIHAQVDHVYVYLDGYNAIPPFLAGRERVSVFHAEDVGDLHASSRFLCLQHLSGPSVVFVADDDILYPADYAHRLIHILEQYEGRAIVGVFGRIFLPPHTSYIHHAAVTHFEQPALRTVNVHEVGTGTCAFVSSYFDVDPRSWERTDMDDIVVATEAQKRGLPRVIAERPALWLKAIAQNQEDSLWVRTQRDDSEQTRRMRALLGMYV